MSMRVRALLNPAVDLDQKRRTFIYGSGRSGRYLANYLKGLFNINVEGFLDSAIDSACDGKRVISLRGFKENISNFQESQIVISSDYEDDILTSLVNLDLDLVVLTGGSGFYNNTHNNRENFGEIFEEKFYDIYKKVFSETMTSYERLYSLFKTVEYIVKAEIPGDFVECGVWKGGSAMAMALALEHFGDTDRTIYLYDTFEGMTAPEARDTASFSGVIAHDLLNSIERVPDDVNNVWCYSPISVVQENMHSTRYPMDKIKFIKGPVEDTLPNLLPQSIALLRLDTDWYSSTMQELNHLYPVLVKNGVLIVDDYGAWNGAKQAVDEYFSSNDRFILLNRIDYTGRVGIKIK